MALGVDEASEAYERAMRNIVPAGRGICDRCWTFVDPAYERCYPCGFQPDILDLVVPITYSEHHGQVHTALRNYKDADADSVRRYAAVRLAAVLWRFLRDHEQCVARAAGIERFDLVTVVPSSDPERDRQSALWRVCGWIRPIEERLQRVLEATGNAHGRDYDAARYRCTENLTGRSVLLLDDTWVTGGHAQSAAYALASAGAQPVALVVIGRHIHRDYEPVKGSGETCGELLDALPEDFDWETCAVH